MPPFASEILEYLLSENLKDKVPHELPEDSLNFDLYVMIQSFAGYFLVIRKAKDTGKNIVVCMFDSQK